MVSLLSVRISNLYSYDQTDDKTEPIRFSNVNVIAGPNDSGKSNIFRSIKLFVDCMKTDYMITDSDTFSDKIAPKLEVKFMLSEDEANLLLDFFGVYFAKPSPGALDLTYIHNFKNREAILASIKEIRVELNWQPTNNASLAPISTFHFEKLGLKIFSNAPNGIAFVTKDFPFKDNRRSQSMFPILLDGLMSEDAKELQAAVDIRDSEGWDFPIMPISISNLGNPVADRAHIERLLEFAGLPPGTSNSLTFSHLMAAILNNSLFLSTGGTIFHKKMSLIEQSQDTSKTIEELLRDTVSYPAPLDSDGWNLAEYLFNLKNSARFEERERLMIIQDRFKKLFPNLSVDVILQPFRLARQVPGATSYRYPNVVISDARNSKEFSISKVGAGISETLFLLTAVFGLNNSVILLDEPAVNLHPAQMKALFPDDW